ncbi:hypothetical protein BY458DRAFT_510128 [Sporodiniella umbellata]|nr:hypothetical protein BY458DRAFT_510128 [Sporodiniella umbellata]
MPNTRSSQPIEESNKENSKADNERKQPERKKRDGNQLNTPKQKLMAQFLQTMIEFDKKHVLWNKDVNATDISLDSIEDRVYKGEYQDLSTFKSDVDALFLSVLPSTNSCKEEMLLFKNLYQFAQDCLKFESKRLNEPVDSKGIYKTVALFRPSIDGFAFSDTIIKESNALSNAHLPQNVYEMVIYPTQPASQDQVPTLKQTVAPPPNSTLKPMKHEEKAIVPIQWLDFGSFSSFSPTFDSHDANITYESTSMERASKRLKTEETDKEENREELNAAWLAREGFNLELIESAVSKAPDTLQEKIEQNSRLLEQLAAYQESRIRKKREIDDKELAIAELLEKNMVHILSSLPPNATLDPDMVEKTMRRLPLYEPAYRGTLQPHKIFSYPTSEKAEILPPYSNITPTYAKEEWRLVKVPQINEPNQPLLSMVEQQQINFYTKPPGFAPQPLPSFSQQTARK